MDAGCDDDDHFACCGGASACCSRPQNRAVMSVLPVPWPDEAHIAAWGVTRQDLPGAASGDAAPT